MSAKVRAAALSEQEYKALQFAKHRPAFTHRHPVLDAMPDLISCEQFPPPEDVNPSLPDGPCAFYGLTDLGEMVLAAAIKRRTKSAEKEPQE